MPRIQWEPKPQVKGEALKGLEVTAAMARKTDVGEMDAPQLAILMKPLADELHTPDSESKDIISAERNSSEEGILSDYHELEGYGYISNIHPEREPNGDVEDAACSVRYHVTRKGASAARAVRRYVSRPRYQRAWITVNSWCQHDFLFKTIVTVILSSVVTWFLTTWWLKG